MDDARDRRGVSAAPGVGSSRIRGGIPGRGDGGVEDGHLSTSRAFSQAYPLVPGDRQKICAE